MKHINHQFIIGTCSSAGKNLISIAIIKTAFKNNFNVLPFKPFAIDIGKDADLYESGIIQTPSICYQLQANNMENNPYLNPITIHYQSNLDINPTLYFNGEKQIIIGEENIVQEFESVIRNSLNQLVNKCDFLIIEGSGSFVDALEFDSFNKYIINLLSPDLILIANGKNGGAYAHVIGTLELMNKNHLKMVKAIILNEFNTNNSDKIFNSFKDLLTKKYNIKNIYYVPELSSVKTIDENSKIIEATNLIILNDEIDFISNCIEICIEDYLTKIFK